VNLFLGLLWLLGGVVLLAWHAFTGDPRFRLPLHNLSGGWACLVLALYNFVRWWSQRSWQQEMRREELLRAQRERAHWEQHRAAYDNPDPTFQFTNEPPPPQQGIAPPEDGLRPTEPPPA
jgi:hypothetical protein